MTETQMEDRSQKDARYIRETNEYVVSGKVVAAKTLTEAELKRLRNAKEARIITGECSRPAGQVIV